MKKMININIENKKKFDKLMDKIKYNNQGLIPAVLQDINSGEVLMLAYMNQKALKKTIEEKRAWFWSRSRSKLWLKGESSGNYQYVEEMKFDCDLDTLLLKVNPAGPACHTGRKSCFYNKIALENDSKKVEEEKILNFILELYDLIISRKNNMPENSYTTKLFKKGLDRISQKVGEEAVEVVIAGKNKDKNEIKAETADLFYHLLVLLAYFNISPADIVSELNKRHN